VSPFGRFQENSPEVYVPREARGEVSNVLAYSRVRLPTEAYASVDAFSYAEGYPVAGTGRLATFDDTNLLEATMVCGPGECCLVQGLGFHTEPWWERRETLDVYARTSIELNVYGQRYLCGSLDMSKIVLAQPLPPCSSVPIRDGRCVLEFMPFPEPIVLREEVPVTVRLRCEARTQVDSVAPDHWVCAVLVGLQGARR
jgi:hypothetical protein